MERLASSKREFGEFGGCNASIEVSEPHNKDTLLQFQFPSLLNHRSSHTQVSTTFTVLHAATLPDIFAGIQGPQEGCYLYGRSFSPSVAHLGRQLASLEDTEAAYCTASGMSAISASILNVCNSGDHIVASDTIYGGTHALFKDFFSQKCNITVSFVNMTDTTAVQQALSKTNTKALYIEAIANPTLLVADLPTLADLAHQVGATFIVDNTFSPLILTPSHYGADVVLHSLTKFVSGASDIVAGAICASKEFIQKLMDLHTGALMLLGPVMDPKVASELSLRLPTLGIRMAEHSRRALYFAENLEKKGVSVVYPGLSSHPQYQLLKSLKNPVNYGFGGMLTLNLGSLNQANLLMERLQNKHGFGLMAVSLGYFDTLMSASAASTSSELSPAELAATGIAPGLVRMSIGLTGSAEQRWAALEESLDTVVGAGPLAQPKFKAVAVTRHKATGKVVHRTPSWQSFGSNGGGVESGGEDDDGSTLMTGVPVGGGSEGEAEGNTTKNAHHHLHQRPYKVRRILGGETETEVVYYPLK